MSSDEKLTTVK